ncbi:2-dehydropantoate 2-reductase [Marinobacteraceae bacterium S3BR75-40.1]
MPSDLLQAPNNQPLRLLILGAGALGRLWASLFSPHCPVTFLTRTSESADTLHYRYQSPDGKHIRDYAIPTIPAGHSQPGRPPLLLWVTTKAPATLAALEAALPGLPPATPVVLFQNGLGSQQAVATRFPDHPVLAATTTEGANRPAPDLLRHAGHGRTVWGAITAAGEPWAAKMQTLFDAAGVQGEYSEDIYEDLWNKLAINAGINPFTLILECRNGELAGSDYFEARISPLCGEIAAIMTANGYPREPQALEARIREVATATAANRSSMLQDYQARRATEIDYINGFLVREANRLGLDAPINQALVDAVRGKTANF